MVECVLRFGRGNGALDGRQGSSMRMRMLPGSRGGAMGLHAARNQEVRL